MLTPVLIEFTQHIINIFQDVIEAIHGAALLELAQLLISTSNIMQSTFAGKVVVFEDAVCTGDADGIASHRSHENTVSVLSIGDELASTDGITQDTDTLTNIRGRNLRVDELTDDVGSSGADVVVSHC